MGCDLCGEEPVTHNAKIEGVWMTTCSDCKEHGDRTKKIQTGKEKKKKRTKNRKKSRSRRKHSGDEEQKKERRITPDYSSVIKKARESRDLDQEEAAKKISIKRSLFHNIESGSKKPSFETAEKIERFFDIELVEKKKQGKELLEEETSSSEEESGSDTLTIGDMMK